MEQIVQLIGDLGFPMACVLGLGAFIFRIYSDTTAENKANLAEVEGKAAEREERLYSFIEESQRINGEFAVIIKGHEEKLSAIQEDITAIKEKVINQ